MRRRTSPKAKQAAAGKPLRRPPVCIYVDNSNIFIGGKETAAARGEDPSHLRIAFHNFLFLVTQGSMHFEEMVWAGSGDEDTETVFKGLKEKGIDLQIIPRAEGGEHETVDHAMQLAMHRHVRKYRKSPGTIVLCSGDGNGQDKERGFLYDLKGFTEDGWNLEVFSWDGVCHQELKTLANEFGKYIPLDDYYKSITFIKNGRNVREVEL